MAEGSTRTAETAGAPSPAVQATPRRLYPLTSFESTPANVSAFSFVLGLIFTYGLVTLCSTPAIDSDHVSRWSQVLASRQLGAYLAAWSAFHMLEFQTTAIYNSGLCSVSSFLLNNGAAYHIAHLAGLAEHVLETLLLPHGLLEWKRSMIIVIFGGAVVLISQFARSCAMIQAASNFSHAVARSKRDGHVLVSHGIYAYSRHPSYAAFFYWAVGTQILLGNPIAAVAFAITLYRFFAMRIIGEEKHLVEFFGQQYVDYRARVPTLLPFLP
ncbi:uncharacterized protein L969DRAFT_19236 [Mixia osmundae IAM 14324]|uniref:Protein-S-isoprenylcysteine O-methyltransferase n=1 Tax=Mixia osmundae (strain CBS 9802 / IAM 14324 / JCM 22182 / KY 12970) TaxID=764103 RepID=G7E4Y9_MIXOS|nr:uncharacterized protein L969DRAFT_19236 [Mixia osmundae IAM 14324]KEI37760.1 hypothetical protein L969DRAFT_19236 [Mixia osmundae IAM 14324]GAA97899.1 hypothetical protein E5Q_04579 [Mixia osmundae IAM 14324]